MTFFDDWYFLNYADLAPESDDMYSQLERCWEAALENNISDYNEGWEEGYSQHKKEVVENLEKLLSMNTGLHK